MQAEIPLLHNVVLQDHTLKLWDMRMATDALHLNSTASPDLYPSFNPQTQPVAHTRSDRTKAGEPGCIATFTGHTEPVTGFAVHDGDVVSYAGPHLGVVSLRGPPYSQAIVPTRLSNVRGGKDIAPIVGLDILPHSRLLVAATDDGVIKICH